MGQNGFLVHPRLSLLHNYDNFFGKQNLKRLDGLLKRLNKQGFICSHFCDIIVSTTVSSTNKVIVLISNINLDLAEVCFTRIRRVYMLSICVILSRLVHVPFNSSLQFFRKSLHKFLTSPSCFELISSVAL